MVFRAIRRLPSASGNPKAVTLKRQNPQIETALNYAEKLYSEKKYIAAEKAYLEVIKLDHKNISAYTSLGKIYLNMKNFADAIECCQIAAQLAPGAPAFANLGSAYFENKNYIKSIAAYEKSIMFEPSSKRYVGLGKAYTKLSNWPKAISALEKAITLEDSRQNQQLLLSAYRQTGNLDKARSLQQTLSQNRTHSEVGKL
ncbi:MAG: tetratricopeptide repeat protein [Candidatus Saccharimonadia bacterium]